MPQIYCGYKDCENNEDGLCRAAAVRIAPGVECLTYTPFKNGPVDHSTQKGDTLTWDEEYFEYEFLDDDVTL